MGNTIAGARVMGTGLLYLLRTATSLAADSAGVVSIDAADDPRPPVTQRFTNIAAEHVLKLWVLAKMLCTMRGNAKRPVNLSITKRPPVGENHRQNHKSFAPRSFWTGTAGRHPCLFRRDRAFGHDRTKSNDKLCRMLLFCAMRKQDTSQVYHC